MPFTTPIALIFFNRPDTLSRVFERVRAMRPRHLFLIADGPRPNRPGEDALCAQAREIVSDARIDWPCEVVREFSETNLGCRDRIVSGLTRLFEVHEEAIILEDDCLPDPSFFPYAAELLERYRNDPGVAFISGTRYLGVSQAPRDVSYQFSTHPSIWGWAAWRRTWEGYDPVIGSWATNAQAQLDWLTDALQAKDLPWNEQLRNMVKYQFDRVHRKELSTWDYQLVHLLMAKQGKCVSPATNLITNIGFTGTGTHTHTPPPEADPESIPLEFPLRHPPTTAVDVAFDRQLARRSWLGHNLVDPCLPPSPASAGSPGETAEEPESTTLLRLAWHYHHGKWKSAGKSAFLRPDAWLHKWAYRRFRGELASNHAAPGPCPRTAGTPEPILCAFYSERFTAARKRTALWFLRPRILLMRSLKKSMKRKIVRQP